MQSYRLKCRNVKCGVEFHRCFKPEEFDRIQYGSDGFGHSCYKCGFPRMITMKSNKSVKDTFEPGFQRNIMKHCSTYAEYKKHLKDMGLIELGYEDMPEHDIPPTNYFDEDMMKLLYEKYGTSLDSREIAHLREKL